MSTVDITLREDFGGPLPDNLVDRNFKNINNELGTLAKEDAVNSALAAVNETLATKANASDVTAGNAAVNTQIAAINTTLATKANSSDVSASLAAVNTSLATKAEAASVNTQISAINTQIGAINTSLATKAASADVAASFATVNAELTAINSKLAKIPSAFFKVSDIGTPGLSGFGVGIAPILPDGYEPLPGYAETTSGNYGNYMYSDGSVMVWVPAFWYRIGHADNPTFAAYGANSIDIKTYGHFETVEAAADQGYVLHRAFIDGGKVQHGYFVDKYGCSNNNGIASSIKGRAPLSTNSTNNPIGALNGAPSNTLGGVFAAAKTRGANFFPASRFMFASLAMLATAHAQASTSATWCAWYDPTGVNNFPKGNNNNALKDTNDTSVQFVSAGNAAYPNCALTGSGTPFAKTTHNGQASGIADINGNMYGASPGLTCVGTTVAVSSVTQANPAVVGTVAPHNRATGDVVEIASLGGMTALNSRLYTITVIDSTKFSLNGVDSTALPAYTSGGTVYAGTFHALKTGVSMKALTGGNALATDHFGATGVAANFDPVALNFNTTYPNNGNAQRFGSAANAVLDSATSGNGYTLTQLGLPKAGGMSTAGTNLFGGDYYGQFFRNEVLPISGATWGSSSNAGAWAVYLYDARASSSVGLGFRAASYL